jgi:hypothetical protein
MGEKSIGHLGDLVGRALATSAASQDGGRTAAADELPALERGAQGLVGGSAGEFGDLGDEGFDASVYLSLEIVHRKAVPRLNSRAR